MKRNLFLFLWMVFVTACSIQVNGQTVTTIGGDGMPGYTGDGAAATLATLDTPTCIALDASGNIYVNDQRNNCVRKINAATGTITTVAGNGAAGFGGDGGPATAANLNLNWGMTADNAGNLYITDQVNLRVRKVSTSGIITTIAGGGSYGTGGDGGQATDAKFMRPFGIAVDGAGNVYVGDQDAFNVRKIDASGIISTIAGNDSFGYSGDHGPAIAAEFRDIWGLATDHTGNLYICDGGNSCVRKVDASGIITTIAGNGIQGFGGDNNPATTANLNLPTGIFADATGNIFIADCHNNRVRKINTSGIITTIGGTGVPGFNGDGLAATATQFNRPVGIVADDSGTFYLTDLDNMRVRTIHKVLYFYNGNVQHLNVCVNLSTQIDSALAIVDHTTGKTIKWDTLQGPLHGHIATFPYFRISSGGYVMPSGLSYTPDGSADNDTITLRVSDGVDTSQTILYLNINPVLTYAGVINGPSSVCVGATITLTDTTGSGAWSMSNLNATNSGGIVTGESQGTDTVHYTLSNACGRVSTTKVITVYQRPDAGRITGDSLLCIGSVGMLADSISGGAWSRSNNFVAINTTGVTTGISPGTDTLIYTVTDANCTNSTAYAITVDPFPTAQIIEGDSAICLGSGTTISGLPDGGSWSIVNNAAAIAGGIITGMAIGEDTINYTYSNFCGSDTTTAFIDVYPLPAAPSIVQNAYVLSVPAGYSSYQWLFNGAAMPAATGDTLVFTQAGLYAVIVQNEYGCSASSPTIECNGCTVNDIQIYPNPTQSVIYISWCKKLTIKLLCIDGREVSIDKDTGVVDLSNLPDAVYLLVMYDENGHKIKTKKIVKSP